MTHNDRTLLVAILDRSGSMSGLRTDTIGGFNTFLAEQKKLPGEAQLTLVLFDHEYLLIHEAKGLTWIPELTADTYVPRGNTALYDAIGRAIDDTGAKLAAMTEGERPARVLVLVVTDGFENASKEYSARRIADMIKHQREAYQWEFVFMGAEEAGLKQARAMNINSSQVCSWDAGTKGGVHALYANVSRSVGSYRAGGSAAPDNANTAASTNAPAEPVKP